MLRRKSEDVPNLIALKVNGEKSVNEVLTTVKFKPQMVLMVISIRSVAENLVFIAAIALSNMGGAKSLFTANLNIFNREERNVHEAHAYILTF